MMEDVHVFGTYFLTLTLLSFDVNISVLYALSDERYTCLSDTDLIFMVRLSLLNCFLYTIYKQLVNYIWCPMNLKLIGCESLRSLNTIYSFFLGLKFTSHYFDQLIKVSKSTCISFMYL